MACKNQDLADSGDSSSGSIGGSITAGNITAVGKPAGPGRGQLLPERGSSNGNLSVAGIFIALGSTNSGELGPWQTPANQLPANRQAGTTVFANGYVYEMGGQDGSTVQATVYYAKLNANGSPGTWTPNAFALPAAREAGTGVAYSGYIYYIAGENSGLGAQSNVYYAKLNADGSTGPGKPAVIICRLEDWIRVVS